MIIEVADQSQIAAARRAAVDIARNVGADEEIAGRVAIVVSELASNLLKYALAGKIIAESYSDSTGEGVEILSLDKGAGIRDLSNAMSDGFSSSGTVGNGLGAIKRQSDQFAIFSRPNQGTAVLARVAVPSDTKPIFANAVLGVAKANYPGELVSGDAWAFDDTGGDPTLLVIDGSGHGPQAQAAALTAVRIFQQHRGENCVRIMELIHQALKSTRGGAAAIARIDQAASIIRFVGIGNISGVLNSNDGLKRMVSHNGTAGLTAPRIREFTYPYAGKPTVILHSDGLSAKWELSSYPGLGASHPSLIAGVLFRDFFRARDDGLIVVMRAA